MTFWEHVEVFRKVVFRCLAVWLVCTIAAFCFKDALFSVLFAPSNPTLFSIADCVGWQSDCLCPRYVLENFL